MSILYICILVDIDIHMSEQLVGTVRGWATCKSLALTVPHHLREEHGFKRGDRFAVKTDAQGSIIYEKISGREGPATNEDPSRQTQPTPATEASR